MSLVLQPLKRHKNEHFAIFSSAGPHQSWSLTRFHARAFVWSSSHCFFRRSISLRLFCCDVKMKLKVKATHGDVWFLLSCRGRCGAVVQCEGRTDGHTCSRLLTNDLLLLRWWHVETQRRKRPTSKSYCC